jgi:streptothricin acetyltransferase
MEITKSRSLTKEKIAGLDFSFEIGEVIAKPYDHLSKGTEIITTRTTPKLKTYVYDEEDFTNLDDLSAVIFTVNRDGQVLGYAHAGKSWNNFVTLNDLALDKSIRGQGHGKRLLDAVVTWARQLGVAGVRLETQNNNVPACRFYKRYGFMFGGYDESLYKGIPEHRDETAFFWYYLFT